LRSEDIQKGQEDSSSGQKIKKPLESCSPDKDSGRNSFLLSKVNLSSDGPDSTGQVFSKLRELKYPKGFPKPKLRTQIKQDPLPGPRSENCIEGDRDNRQEKVIGIQRPPVMVQFFPTIVKLTVDIIKDQGKYQKHKNPSEIRESLMFHDDVRKPNSKTEQS